MGSDSGAGYYYFGDGIYAIYPSLDVVQVLTKVTFDQGTSSIFIYLRQFLYICIDIFVLIFLEVRW